MDHFPEKRILAAAARDNSAGRALSAVLDDYAQERSITREQAAIEFTTKGHLYMGEREGTFAINVYADADGNYSVEWVGDPLSAHRATEGTWAGLWNIVENANSGCDVPHWFDPDWIAQAA